MKDIEAITRLRAALTYDKETGLCTWMPRPIEQFAGRVAGLSWNTKYAGKTAGCVHRCDDGKAYIVIRFEGRDHSAHRLIWAIVTGEWPEQVDHEDGCGINNKWDNLRATDKYGNARNHRRKHNRLLPTGVRVSGKKFYATIKAGKKPMHLGTFDTVEAAAAARKSAERTLGFHPNHGQVRPL